MSNALTYCKAFLWSHHCTCIAQCHLHSWECRFLCHHKENCPSHRHSVWNNYWYFRFASIDVLIILLEKWIFRYFLISKSNWNLKMFVLWRGKKRGNLQLRIRIRTHCAKLVIPFKRNNAISLNCLILFNIFNFVQFMLKTKFHQET